MPASLQLFLGMMAFFLVTLTIIFRFEKRMVWPYSDPQPQPSFVPPKSGYAELWAAKAISSGFRLLGWSGDLKGANYRVIYAMLVSPDRSTFAVIGAGNILNMKLACTWLHTPSADGRSFFTTDNQTGVQIDLSGHWTNHLRREPSFDRLWGCHQEWLREMGVIPRGFTEGREFTEFRELRKDHFHRMANAGLIHYTDSSAEKFQFTLFGAAKTASWGYFLGLSRALTAGRFPKNA
jgi:hypothetical protein